MSRGRTASSKTCTRILNEVRQSAAVSIAKIEACFSKLCCPDEQLSVKILSYTRNIFLTRKADENKCYLVFFRRIRNHASDFFATLLQQHWLTLQIYDPQPAYRA